MTLLKTQAIQTALLGDWNTAITLNQELIKNDPTDIEALNRLAFAFSVVGRFKNARATYQKVLLIDILNPIAQRGLKRLAGNVVTQKKTSKQTKYTTQTITQVNNIFLEETGKTKVVELINTAERKTTISLRTGESVQLNIKRLKVFVLDSQKQYLGMLPDNIGIRLIKFMKGGNDYEAYVKSVMNNRVIVFIKEVKRSVRFKNQPSFISSEKSPLLLEKSGPAKKVKNSNFDDNEGNKDDHFSSDEEPL